MAKYDILVKILDDIREGAVSNKELYLPEPTKEKIETARSRALLHFFLKSYFGELDFNKREDWITEGTNDGGLDAYYINTKSKTVYLIQAKFRINSSNYATTCITDKELRAMELVRVVGGKENYASGASYNDQVHKFQKRLQEREGGAEYEYVVVILANYTDSQVKSILPSQYPKKKWRIELFNHLRVYNELLFPYTREDFFLENKLVLNVPLTNSDEEPIEHEIETEYGACTIHLLFVPTEEIGRALTKFRNSILKFNPRAYLGMKSMSVNRAIEDSIIKKDTNDFILFNNGITILSKRCDYSGFSGKDNTAQISITDPQIINGGQTSFALSHIYERLLRGEFLRNPFTGKEVLLKVIVPANPEKYTEIASPVSLATNSQSAITKGDLLSNNPEQISLQKYIFEKHGLFYERKKGEFFNSLASSYIKKDEIIDREEFIRMAYASAFPESIKNPKNLSKSVLFSDEIFDLISMESNYSRYVLSYLIYRELQSLKVQAKKPKNEWFLSRCGNALRYGDVAVAMVTTNNLAHTTWKNKDISTAVNSTLDQWKDFEEAALLKKENLTYFNEKAKEFNPIAYYKSDNLIRDLIEYFG